MRKKGKRVILAIVLLLMIAAGVAGYMFYPFFTMKPTKSGGIVDTNIYAVRVSSNAIYFIKTDSGYIMIDAGMNEEMVEEALANNQIDIADVKWILLTHSDTDHVGGLSLFPEAEIYMAENELPLADGSVKRNAFGSNQLPIRTDRIKLLKGDEEFVLDETVIKAIDSSGHTIGHMAYLVEEQYIFTGDAFQYSDGKLSVHPFSMDKEESRQTIAELEPILNDSSHVLTAHYGYYQNQ